MNYLAALAKTSGIFDRLQGIKEFRSRNKYFKTLCLVAEVNQEDRL